MEEELKKDSCLDCGKECEVSKDYCPTCKDLHDEYGEFEEGRQKKVSRQLKKQMNRG